MNANPKWIPWTGGECPIPDEVKAWEYKARDGFICRAPVSDPSAYTFFWNHEKHTDFDIVAYRFIP